MTGARRIAATVATAALVATACANPPNDGTPDAGPALWDLACPGGAGCADDGDGVLHAGAAAEKITPTLVETQWDDADNDHYWDRDEAFTDVNGNGRFDATWVAGFGAGRPATGVHDDTWARALALRRNGTTIVVASLDVVGYFNGEVEKIRALLPASLGVDLLVVTSTHTHETQDTVGMWGPDDEHTGISQPYMELLRTQTAKAIAAAVAALRPARLTAAQMALEDPAGDWHRFLCDDRDPQVADSTMSVLRFSRADQPAASAATIATWVVWGAHAEFSGSRNNLITPDFPGMLRRVVETDGASDLPALGGIALYSNGPIGSQIGPCGATVPVSRPDGTPLTTASVERADEYGRALGAFALKALKSAQAETLEGAALAFRTKALWADVENFLYHTAFLLKIFDRPLQNYDATRPFSDDNLPQVRTEVAYLQIGPVGLVTLPGELNPELYLGGYDGSRAGGRPVVDTTRPNFPDVSKAPAGPYLRDLLLARPGIRFPVALGLAQDEVGYILPEYDFLLSEDDPYFSEAEGEHYEETNSIGPKADEQIAGPLRAMLAAP